MEATALGTWIQDQLSALLGFDACGDFCSYLLTIETKSDLEEYLQELLDTTNPKHKKFIQELLKRWHLRGREVVQSVPEGAIVYKKDSDVEKSPPKGTKLKGGKSNQHVPVTQQESKTLPPKSEEKAQEKSPKSVTPTHKTKFVPLFSPEGRDKSVIKIPGRHPCLCQAHKHDLVNNCLSCGRVVCKQEGSGPCVFCGTLVCTEEELELIARGSRKGEKLQESLMRGSGVPKFHPEQEDSQTKKAKEHKDKLINYDKTSTRRTKVIDDESDYYATDNKWLSSREREQLQKKKDDIHSRMHASRREKKLTFDFAGRTLIDATFDPSDLDKEDSVEPSFAEDITNLHKHMTSGISNPAYLNEAHKPQFQLDDSYISTNPVKRLPMTSKRNQLRLQDKGLQEVVDNGMCLSMHQPWASLLVAGIKVHEGRTWYSAHRGRLWIGSTARVPEDIEISSLEMEYTQALNDDGADLQFPHSYPVSCLLGCVDIVDVLPQDEYRQQFPNGESASPYVFVCEHPQELMLKFPIKGQHKIYKLDSQMHKAARMGL